MSRRWFEGDLKNLGAELAAARHAARVSDDQADELVEALRDSKDYYLKKAGLTQQEAAVLAQVSKHSADTIRLYENGSVEPSKKVLALLCAAYGVDQIGVIARALARGNVERRADGLSAVGFSASFLDRTIPSVPEYFDGRQADLRFLLGLLTRARALRTEARVCAVRSVHGLGGVGKTSFAAYVAGDGETRSMFRGGVFWASVGQEPQASADLARWGKLLGDSGILGEFAQGKLAQRLKDSLPEDALLVLDDVWRADDVAAYRMAFDGRAVIVVLTRLPSVAEGVVPSPSASMELGGLSDTAAMAVFDRLAPGLAERDRRRCADFFARIANLPLAVVVVARVVSREMRRGANVSRVIDELVDEGARAVLGARLPIEAVDGALAEPTVMGLLMRTVRWLTPVAKTRFCLLGGFPPKPATFTMRDAEEVWGGEAAGETMRELTDAGLVETLRQGRFQMHALLVALSRATETGR